MSFTRVRNDDGRRLRSAFASIASGRLARFGGSERVRFRRQVLPGDRRDLHVDRGRVSARAGKGSGRASVDGETACECELLFVFADSA